VACSRGLMAVTYLYMTQREALPVAVEMTSVPGAPAAEMKSVPGAQKIAFPPEIIQGAVALELRCAARKVIGSQITVRRSIAGFTARESDGGKGGEETGKGLRAAPSSTILQWIATQRALHALSRARVIFDHCHDVA